MSDELIDQEWIEKRNRAIEKANKFIDSIDQTHDWRAVDKGSLIEVAFRHRSKAYGYESTTRTRLFVVE